MGILLMLVSAAAAGIILPRKFYEYRARNTMGDGVPAIAYIAMGMQWDEGRSPGGWNGYHSDLFMECSFDAELTARISLESVKDSLRYMAEHPGYMAEFYYRKLIEQWEREDFWCLSETLDFYGERTPAAWSIYEGEAKDKFLAVMSAHQSIIYLGACGFCISGAIRWRQKKNGGGQTCRRGRDRAACPSCDLYRGISVQRDMGGGSPICPALFRNADTLCGRESGGYQPSYVAWQDWDRCGQKGKLTGRTAGQ